jgi:hypothetical protein
MDPPAVSDDLLLVSGVDGATGGYLLPPLRPAVVAAVARGEPVDRHELLELRARHRRTAVEHLGPVAEVDPSDLAEAGWGVVFARDADPAVRRALRPLLDHRRRQATSATGPARYREFAGADGYQPGETAADFLVRHQVAPGQPADPCRMPYYLLLVGDPEAIPFGFQYRLDIVYAVGRLDLETPEDYERYALGVVDSERAATAAPPQVTFFATRHPDDRPTRLSADHLVAPLARAAARLGTWPVGHVAGEAATKARLGRLLGGEAAPGLLFLAGHGMGFAGGDPRQRSHQGALLCQDWPGPLAWRAPIPPELYFAGDDLAGDARLDGLGAMRPGGPFLREWLNQGRGGDASDHAVAADYEPADPGLAAWAKDGIMDRIFGRAGNDLVVPTLGVYDGNGSGCFPIAEPLVLAEGVHHNGFFASAAARDKLLEWLPG